MKTVVMLLAYNAEKTLAKTVQAIPESLRKNILMGDDASKDRTSQVAKELGLEVFRHEKNLNYGGNLRFLMKQAISAGADVAVELHADYQYEPCGFCGAGLVRPHPGQPHPHPAGSLVRRNAFLPLFWKPDPHVRPKPLVRNLLWRVAQWPAGVLPEAFGAGTPGGISCQPCLRQ
ncbi:MAG: glycosyltransferase [Verrucomicrobia bacterium]|nr:glycosyltransferase [Verrucomicrobiota bacterium]